MVLPWIFYQEESGVKRKVSDIEFLSIKEFDNKLITEFASFNTTGVKITHTVPNGKTFYLSKCAFMATDAGNVDLQILSNTVQVRSCFITIKYDGTIIDRLHYNFASQGVNASDPGGMATSNDKWGSSIIGKSLQGTGAGVNVEIEVTAISGNYAVILEGFEEDTGTSPAI